MEKWKLQVQTTAQITSFKLGTTYDFKQCGHSFVDIIRDFCGVQRDQDSQYSCLRISQSMRAAFGVMLSRKTRIPFNGHLQKAKNLEAAA